MRATINGINVWTHILERVADPTAARAVEGIRRSISQQTELAQEISDFGRDVFAAPGAQPADIGTILLGLREELRAGARLDLRLPPSGTMAPVGERALRALLRFILGDALTGLSERGRLQVGVEEADAGQCRLRVDVLEPGTDRLEAHARRPLRQTLALLAARAHGLDLDITVGHSTLIFSRPHS
ncbi:MAG: hypothetical protein IT532_13975 [Burkholderiales bacterium]|nr:hypothetical protein [Burkholderiales bacterium]